MTSETHKTEWITLALTIFCMALWFGAGMMWQTGFWPVSLVVLPVLAAFHTSLQHETIHGHPTRWPWLNEVLVSLPIAAVFPYRRYKDLHLKHHDDMNLTDPYEDPESYFWPLQKCTTMSPLLFRMFEINNTFVGRLMLGPFLTIIGFARTEFHRLIRKEPGVALAWFYHAIGLALLAAIIIQVFAMPIWIYMIFVIYPALSLTAMRAYAEHQAAENVGARTAVVETHPAVALLYLNNNLHIAHHASPRVPWYHLPHLYRERRTQFLNANGHTIFHGYGDIARRFAFTAKQSVDHPYMRREITAPETDH